LPIEDRPCPVLVDQPVIHAHAGSHTREGNRAIATWALRNVQLPHEGRVVEMDLPEART